MKARGMTAEQVKRDVLLAAQPTKEFVTVDRSRARSRSSCPRCRRKRSPARIYSIDGGWTAE